MTGRPAWVPDAVFYQIFPDRFRNADPANDPPGSQAWGSPPTREHFQGGDLAGVLQGLEYLEDLGITAVYLTPIFAAGTNHRYDTHDYLQVDPALGDEGLLKELVQEAHGRGIRVILDGVFNHCGDGHWAFRDVMEKGSRSIHADWFLTTGHPIRQDVPNYRTCGGTSYLPKLNTSSPMAREHLLRVAAHWIEVADIDGWRLDVPWKVPMDFWEEFRRVVKDVKPDAYLVGEIWRDATPWLEVFDGVMNYRLRDAILDFSVRDHMDAEDFAYETKSLLGRHGEASPWMLNLVGSHDTARLLTLAGGDGRRVQVALAALFTLPGVPMIYYGDEIGLEGGEDPDCRRAMNWEPGEWNGEIRQTSRTLAMLRRSHPALRHGTWESLLEFDGMVAYRRREGSDDLVVVLNPRNARRDVVIPLETGDAHWHDLLGGSVYPTSEGASLRLSHVAAGTALILAPGTGA